jgi:hypothetical protein
MLQKARRQAPEGTLRPVVSTRFQILFHSPRRGSFHLSITVLVRYRSSHVFSLGEWTPHLPAELACSAVLFALPVTDFVYRVLTFSDRLSQVVRPVLPVVGAGLFRFRSPLLAESFLFLRVLRCFSSPTYPPLPADDGLHRRVSPFGHHWLFTPAHG